MHVLHDEQAGDQPGRQRRLAWPRLTDRGEALLQETPVDLLRQPHQRVAQVDDLIQRRPEQVLLTLIAGLRHRLPPSNIPAPRESRTETNRNPKSQETRLQTLLSCKIDCSLDRTYPSPTARFEFFTDDSIAAKAGRHNIWASAWSV